MFSLLAQLDLFARSGRSALLEPSVNRQKIAQNYLLIVLIIKIEVFINSN